MTLSELRREEADERAQDRADFESLTPAERRAFRKALSCLHAHVAWRSLTPAADGRLHAICPECHSEVSRSAFTH